MSYVYGVGVAQPQSELHMRSRSCGATIGVGGAESELRSHDRSCMCGVGNGWSPYTKYTLDADYYLPILPLPPLWLTSRSIASLKWYVLFSLSWRPGFISHNFA
jgi:hypothetical protein